MPIARPAAWKKKHIQHWIHRKSHGDFKTSTDLRFLRKYNEISLVRYDLQHLVFNLSWWVQSISFQNAHVKNELHMFTGFIHILPSRCSKFNINFNILFIKNHFTSVESCSAGNGVSRCLRCKRHTFVLLKVEEGYLKFVFVDVCLSYVSVY